uniref:Galectin domain-containing protein n=1 Tax=Meloidogyne incognita TaxID=6306 RepID=A0A914M6Q6_MELIC
MGHNYTRGQYQSVPYRRNRKAINDLKINGTIVYFEALIPSGSKMNYKPSSFVVQLIHDPQITNNLDVDVVMQLVLNFEPDRNTGRNEPFITLSHSQILIQSYSPKKKILINEKHYKNPIGPGMPIVMRIIASGEGQYIININEGDNLFYYQNAYPHWSINRVEVFGYIYNVLFNEKSDKCQKLTSNIPEAKLDANTKRIEKQLNSRSEVIIRGKTPDIFRENITINFLHAAIKWNETCLILDNLIISFLRSLYNGIMTIIKNT